MQEVIKGEKAGSGKTRTPVISPDTAQSRTYIKALHGLSWGEIKGIEDNYNLIYVEDTPLQDANGAWNFQNITVETRNGTNDQDYIQGFPDVTSETQIGVELKNASPWVKAISNLDLDAVSIRFRFDALKESKTNGDIVGTTVEYAVDLQTDGGAWVEVVKAKVADKTSPNYERQHRIELPKADHGWQIRARRITPDSTSDLISDKMHVWAMIETIDAKLAYPNIAQLFLQYDAETFGGNVAKVSVRTKGVMIPVASNYDPETRKYNGLWDGTFKFAYTDNNAWHFLNICLNKEYGLGDRLDASMVDKWSVYQLAQYCDELVPDGKGGFEPRFTLNVYLQSQEDAWSILQKIAASFRAFIFWDGQRIQLGADVPQDSVYTYTSANIIGLPEYTGTAAEDRHNVIQVNWDNPNNRYKTEPLFVREDKFIATQGIKKLEIDAWGVTSEGQAQRAGQWALKSEKYETRTVTFKVGLDALVRDESYLPQVGRVIELADPLFAGRDNGGRIVAVSKDLLSITLDRDDVVCRAGDRLVVNGDLGKSQARVVSKIQGRVITVVAPFDPVSVQNVWAIDAQDLATMKFRVVSITQNEQHEFTINGLQYNPAKYEAIDNAAFIDERPISIINPTLQAPVKKVTLTSEAMIQQGLNVANLLISWEQVAGATKYQVEWRKDNGAWIKLPITGGNLAEVQGIYAGKYEARVTAISAFDIASLPTYSVVTELKGKQGKPPKVAFIKATGVLFGMKLNWGYPANALDTAYVEIRVSPDGKANIATLGSFAYPTTTTMIQGLQPNLTQFYSARLIDRIGNVGDWSEWVNGTTTSNANDVLNLLEGQITDSQLSKDLSSSIDSAGLNSVEAKNTANLAKQAADLAKQSADVANSLAGSAKTIADTAIKNANDAKAQATETATDLKNQATSLKADYDKQIKDLSDGVTNSITLVKADNDSTLSALNAYKTSNNNALSVVSSKVDNVTTAQTSTATKVDGLTARMTTAEGNISKKLDATVLTTLATKAEANKAATDAVAVYDSTLTIGATNLATVNSRLTPIDLSLAATVFYQDFNTGVYANADETFTASILINKKVGFENVAINWTIGIGPTVTGAYLRDIAGATYTNVPDGVRVSITFKVLAADIASGTPERRFIMFRLRNEKVAAQFSFSQFKLERGTKATEWSANPSDIQNQLNANATAIQSTNTVVTNVDGKIISTSNALTTLTNRVTATEGSINKKADASAVTALQNQVTQQGNSISSHANNITTLQTSLDNLTIGGNNLITQGDGVLRIGSAGAFTDTRTIVGGDIYITGTGTGCTSWNAWYALGTDFSEVVNLNDGEQFTVTLFAKPKDLTKLPTISTLAFYMGAGYGYATMTQNVPFSAKGGEVMFSVTFKKGAALAPNPHINAVWSLNGGLIFTRWKVEKGNKSTDWSDNANSLAQAIDANATAIQNTNASVTQQGKDITSQSASITALQNSLTATNNNVATKADSSALTELGNTVTKQGETLMAQGNSITSVQTSLNDLTIGSVNVLLNSEGERSSTATSQREYLLYERSEQLKAFYDDNLGKPVTISFEVSMPFVGQLQIYASNQTYHAFASSVQVTQANVWQKIIVTVFPSKHTGNTDPTRSTLEFFGVGYGSGRIPTVRKVQMESGNKATAWSPSPRDFQKAIDANASAITTLGNTVTQQGKDISSQGSSITTLQNNLTTTNNNVATKADSSALISLSGRVTAVEGNVSSQSNSITSIQSSLNNLDSVKLPDTRSTNQSPSWYWTNYPMKRVTEFKSASTLGLTGMGTYVALETIVPWSDSSGGAIIQIARSQDSTLTAERSSTGSGASATWIAFKQNIKDISTLVGQKADASAVSSLSTKVDNVDGKVASQASQLTTLSTTVGLNTSSISQQNTVINGINARSTLKLQAGNLVGGVAIENDTKTIDFIVQANKFAIGAPSNTSDTVNPSYAFVYQSTATTLPNGTVIPKGLYLDSAFISSIDANRINATSLSAISANLGTFTSTATDGSKQVISGALTQGFYANGQMAFRLGIW